MDSAGAFAGPLVALAVLTFSGQAFDAVLVVSGLADDRIPDAESPASLAVS